MIYCFILAPPRTVDRTNVATVTTVTAVGSKTALFIEERKYILKSAQRSNCGTNKENITN